jgi:hypothetical protein
MNEPLKINVSDKDYYIITSPGIEYSTKRFLENYFLMKVPDQHEDKLEYELLPGLPRKYDPNMISDNNEIKRKSKNDVKTDLRAYSYYIKMDKISPELHNRILEWEQGVLISLQINPKDYNRAIIPLFVKVFTFINGGYRTRYKKLAEIFQMSHKLFDDFYFHFLEY